MGRAHHVRKTVDSSHTGKAARDAGRPNAGMAAARERIAADEAKKQAADARAQDRERKRIATARETSNIEQSMRALQLDVAKEQRVQTPMYRVTYMLQVSKLDDTFLEAINKHQDITLMNTRFQPHIVPGTEEIRATMTVTNDTRQHLHVLMMHLAALGYSGIDSEAALLGLLRRNIKMYYILRFIISIITCIIFQIMRIYSISIISV